MNFKGVIEFGMRNKERVKFYRVIDESKNLLLSMKKPHVIWVDGAGFNGFYRNQSLFTIIDRGGGTSTSST